MDTPAAGTGGALGGAGGTSSASAGQSAAAGSGDSTGAPTKFVGNITTGGTIRADFARYWNQLTPENEGKWSSIEPVRDEMRWNVLDAQVQYARDHGFPFKQHTLVWGQQAPAWLAQLPQAEQREEVEEWIRLFCERYPDVPLIDVVNEPDHATPVWSAALGGAGTTGHDWVVWSFRTARKYCPKAKLILNDYNVLRWDTDKFIAIARKLKTEGLLDAVGAQAHGLETQSLAELKANLAKVVALGVPLYISEYDIDEADDARQQAIMAEQFPVFWETPEIAGITLWGYIYGSTWKPNTGLMKGDTPRPAFSWLMKYLGR